MDKDRIYGFLSDLHEILTTEESLQLPRQALFNEELQAIEANVIFSWRERVDSATVDLAIRWLEAEVDLHTALPRWNDLYYEDPDLSPLLRRLTRLVTSWKDDLAAALIQDESAFAIPEEIQSPAPPVYSRDPSRETVEYHFNIINTDT